jgi:hypothetical protein
MKIEAKGFEERKQSQDQKHNRKCWPIYSVRQVYLYLATFSIWSIRLISILSEPCTLADFYIKPGVKSLLAI